MARDWDEHYASRELPWDTGRPAAELVALVEEGGLPAGRALDIGCGTGTNVRYLAGRGYEAVGVDVAELAVERAKQDSEGVKGVSFHHLDFLSVDPPGGSFDLVFDRGCFHTFDSADEQARFARRVADCLSETGVWVSLLGSTEGPERDHGPPRRSARDIALAVEPALEIVGLRGVAFDVDAPTSVRGWVLTARRRSVPAQPSSVHP